jgi:F-box/WD-40 domain protein 7
MDIMHDPVVCATGMTYNRASITRWLEAGHKTCPSTGQRLRHLELVPNFALRCAIVVRVGAALRARGGVFNTWPRSTLLRPVTTDGKESADAWPRARAALRRRSGRRRTT